MRKNSVRHLRHLVITTEAFFKGDPEVMPEQSRGAALELRGLLLVYALGEKIASVRPFLHTALRRGYMTGAKDGAIRAAEACLRVAEKDEGSNVIKKPRPEVCFRRFLRNIIREIDKVYIPAGKKKVA